MPPTIVYVFGKERVRGPLPITAIAIAFATGVVLAGSQGGLVVVILTIILAVIAGWKREWRVLTLAACVWLVAGHWRASDGAAVSKDDVGLCRVAGVVSEARIVRVSPSESRYGIAADYTRMRLDVLESTTVSLVGHTVDLFVTGHVVNLDPGDGLETSARLEIRDQPANPGERWTHVAGTPFLRVDHPDAVTVLPHAGWSKFRSRVRRGLSRTLRRNLGRRESALAETLLLGNREHLDRNTSDAFRETGTGHLLAISGLHLGLIAWLLLAVMRRVTRSLRWQTIAVCSLIVLYASVVEPRASVMRATVFAVLTGVAVLTGRQVASFSLLAVAMIGVLLADPAQIYQPGAQLSFAAVAGIVAIVRFGLIERLTPAFFSVDAMTSFAGLRRILEVVWRTSLWGVLLWAATAPLAVYHFRWVTAWAALLHVFCFPLVAMAMGFLLVALVVELWLPIAGPLWALGRGCLALLATVVEAAASVDMVSWTVAQPSGVFVGGVYLLVVLVILARGDLWRRVAKYAAIAFVAVCAVAAVWGTSPRSLRITTLSVGHGLCVAIQTPDGHNVLYDVGSLSDPERVGTQISDALLAVGVDSLDAIIVSHADQDHFGAIAPILNTFHVERIYCHDTFLAAESRRVLDAMNAIQGHEIPIALLAAGDQLTYGDVTVDILHPAENARFEDDNANSLVGLVSFANRTVLLTGDVEEAGADSMMRTVIEPVDVLLAPHHGGRTSNTPELAAWAKPAAVISSSGRSSREFLTSIYGSVPLFETDVDGAVTMEIIPSGLTRVSGFRGREAAIEVRVD